MLAKPSKARGAEADDFHPLGGTGRRQENFEGQRLHGDRLACWWRYVAVYECVSCIMVYTPYGVYIYIYCSFHVEI